MMLKKQPTPKKTIKNFQFGFEENFKINNATTETAIGLKPTTT